MMDRPARKNKLILVSFVFITLLGFIGWVGFLYLIWLWLTSHQVSVDYWVMVQSLSGAVTAAAVFSAGFIAYKELSEVAASRHMDIADRLFDELNSPEAIASRRWIFQNLADDPEQGLQTLSTEGQAAIKQVLNSLDRVAFLTQSGWIDDGILMPWMHPMIAKAWDKLEPYVAYERSRRNEPYYYQHVSELGRRCREWREAHLPGTPVKWVKNAL